MYKPGKKNFGLCIERRKSMTERGRCFSMAQATLCGAVAVDKNRLVRGR